MIKMQQLFLCFCPWHVFRESYRMIVKVHLSVFQSELTMEVIDQLFEIKEKIYEFITKNVIKYKVEIFRIH